MRLLAAIALLLAAAGIAASARTYSAAEVPNVHTADRTRFTSNPDGILSPGAQTLTDSIVAGVRRATTAEMMVVVVDNIEPDDIDSFATELFGLWGLGKADRDNGVLLLVAKDLRKAVIRTGYGAEGVLPDIVCGSILREHMFPAFRVGDFDGGVTAAAQTIATLLTDPDAAEELRSSLEDADSGGSGGDGSLWKGYVTMSALVAFVMLGLLLMRMWSLRRRSRYERYRALDSWKPMYLIFGFATLGMGLVAAVILVAVLDRLRNGRRACPNCGARMNKIDEVHDNDYLSPAQDIEEKVGSVDYDVWLCPSCGETDVLPYVNRASSFRECEQCHARTARLSAERILRQPTTAAEGRGVREYSCLNCRHITRVPYTIARKPPVVVVPLGGGRGGGNFGGGSFGGGFGGGMTGGGGASGGW